MRSLESSSWFASPSLDKVVASGDAFEFALTVTLDPSAVVVPESTSKPEEKPAKGKKKASKK